MDYMLVVIITKGINCIGIITIKYKMITPKYKITNL